ncbi:hypothetical protein K492DRAFT_177707 [Lichtheimia hyalospora FSU 10163]|nr:hypothetical protein K492DRAFT_177707 [Lichtheimia hyalospora FSU 10163]
MSCCCCCVSKRKSQPTPEPLAEPNVFDLTWRNYLVPSQLFPNCCGINRRQPIRLEEDDDELFLGPDYYRDYLDTRDWETDPYNDYSTDTHRQHPPPPFLLPPHQQQAFADIVTRNPFGKSHVSKKKKKSKKNKHVRDVDFLADHEQDAEFLGDEQIAHLAYNRYSKGDMDQYGEEAYLDGHGGPIVQEMQTPPQHKEYYAARSMPSAYLLHNEQDDNDDDQPPPKNNEASSSTSNDQVVVVKAAQNLLSDRLEDLTDKLVYIKNNIMDINHLTPEEVNRSEQEDDDQADKTTLRTLNKSPVVSSSSDKDMDSVASEALDEYESHPIHRNEDERRRSGASQFNFPFAAAGGSDSPPFGSDHHPFSYFTNHHRTSYHDDDDDNTPGLSIRGVLNFGKNWLGGGDSP